MKKELSAKQRDELQAALQARFDANQGRHPGLAWANRIFIGHNGAESYYSGRSFAVH